MAVAVRDLALSEIKRTWSVEEADITEREDGFDWLPGSHLVKVRIVEDAREPVGVVRYRITVTTECLRAVPVHDMTFVRIAGLTGALRSPTYSQVFPPSEIVEQYFAGQPASMDLFSSAYVDDDTVKWTSGFLARMSIMQPINAELLSRSPKFMGPGEPALAKGSIQPTVNNILNIHEDLLIPEGTKPSAWAGSREFALFIEERGKNDHCFGFGDEHGMSFETPFASDSAFVRLSTDQGDNQLGNGLTIEIKLPLWGESGDICKQAAWLNYYESVLWTDFPQLGRWHPLPTSEQSSTLAHTTFVPNALWADGLVINLALWSIVRVRWARERLLPNKKDLTMIEILESRFGRSLR